MKIFVKLCAGSLILFAALTMCKVPVDNDRDPVKPDTTGWVGDTALQPVCAESENVSCFKVIYPKGGEIFYTGDSVLFQFCSGNLDFCDFDQAPVTISVDKGKSWVELFDGAIEENRRWWLIPDSISQFDGTRIATHIFDSDNCILKIQKYSSATFVSSNIFSIKRRP